MLEVMMTPTEEQAKECLIKNINCYYTRVARGAFWWSCAFHVCLYASIIFSAGAALILKIPTQASSPSHQNVAAILAALAALLTTISASGNFQTKWRVSRSGRSAIDCLRVDLIKFTDYDALAERIKDIMTKHAEGISGSDSHS
jgi:hypothetical protein